MTSPTSSSSRRRCGRTHEQPVRPRARVHADRGGDPLDGLVNLFDLGVVLAVAFLLAALASLDLTGVLTRDDVTVVRSGPDGRTIITKRGEKLQRLRLRPASRSPGRDSGSAASTGSPTADWSTPRAADVEFLWDGLRQAVDLLLSGDDQVLDIVGVTLRMAFWSTLLALAAGLPLGLLLGLGRFRGRGGALALVNAGMGLPPVIVGLVVALLLFRGAPLGGLDLLYTLNGVILAQAVLAFPIVAALTASAVQSLPDGLLDQARAFGASRTAVAALALREARIGVLAATIAAAGSAFAEVGAVVLVGGNIQGQTQTLASAVLVRVSAGEYGTAIALGILLLGLVLILAAALTAIQQRQARTVLGRPS